MFRTKQALSEKQPPTRAPELPALKRANDQAMIYFNDIQARPNTTVAICMTRMDYTRQQISFCCVRFTVCSRLLIQLFWCSCIKNRCVPPCECASAQLVCTEMCSCNGDETCCDNVKRDIEKYDKMRLKRNDDESFEKFDFLYRLSWTLEKNGCTLLILTNNNY